MARLELRLLGPFEAVLAGEIITGFETVKVRALAAYLATEMGHPHYRASLGGLLWPDWPQPSAMRNLRHALAVLRKVIGDRQADPPFLLISREALQFNQESDAWVDVATLEQGIDPAKAKSAARPSLQAAVNLYRGPFLEGFSLNDSPAFEEWVLGKREYLNRLALQGLHSLAEIAEAAGNYTQGLAYARRQLELEPWLEEAHRQVMRLLAQEGQRSAALAQYETCQALLMKELDVQPSADTTRLYEAIRDGEFGKASWEHILSALDLQTAPRHNLPAPLTSFVGREREKVEVTELLASARLVTLIGPPGTGKTRLGLEIAHQALGDFPGGVFFVALAPLEDPSLIAPVMVQALGYVEPKNLPAEKILVDGIGEKQMLILLDNCEHLIEDIALLSSDLLAACPRLKILATSRESLRLPGEWLYTVPALELPDASSPVEVETGATFPALRLFAERGRAVHSDFALDPTNIQTVASICAQLDGLPLAIELIAARVRWMSPQEILKRLKDQFVLSSDGMRTVSSRQKTLNNAIGWSYDLLSQEQQNLFACLSLFSGSFTLSAAETIFMEMFAEKTVSDLIVSLSDKNLLQHSFDARGETRFSMLVTLRLFASQRLIEFGQAAAMQERHAAYFLKLAEEADKHVHGPDQVDWMDRLDVELDNFRAALDWWLSSRATGKLLRLFVALGWTWLVRWPPSENRSWYHKIRALPDVVNYPNLYAHVLNKAARLEWREGNYDEARSLAEESRVIWLGLGVDGEHGLAEDLCSLGMIEEYIAERNHLATSYFEQSFELYQKYGDRWGMAFIMQNLGNVGGVARDGDSALVSLKQSLDLFHELGDPWGMARTSQFLGQLFLAQGDYKNARLYFDQHLKLDESLRFKEGITVALVNLGQLHRYLGNYDQAEYFYQRSLSLGREYGFERITNDTRYALGLLALQRNNYPLAMQLFTDYFISTSESSKKVVACDFFTGSAAVAGGQGQPDRAAKLYGAAQAIFETTDYHIPPFDRAEFDRHIQIARDQLGEARFEAFAAVGRSMTQEQAVAYALENQSE